ncbi:type II secretion system protein GspL [Marinomonas gallaica]|uniref:type II secretion system protein GspL n=1 Tax=Marinomonas gallaica TaxID=1806667 RepID=UPI000AF562EF|nr:type II secretion system protein GspL [Marinomonas gallaica]
MQRLMIQLRETHLGHGHWVYDWWCFDDQKMIQQGMVESNTEMAALYQEMASKHSDLRVFFFPPHHRFHVRKLAVTKHQRRHMDKVLPYLMEPYLAQPIESLAFFWVPDSPNQIWAMTMDKSLLADWQADLQSISRTTGVILPLQFVVSHQTQNGAAEVLGERFEVSQDQLCWLPEELSATHPPTTISQVYDLDSLNEALAQETQWKRWRIGEIKEITEGVKITAPRWQWAAGLVVVALAAQWLNSELATQEINSQALEVEQASNELFLSLVPSAGRVVNLSRQLDARLQQASQQQDQSTHWSAYELLGKLGDLQKTLNIESGLQQVTLRQQVYRFEWLAASRTELERIQTFLVQQNVSIELVQWARQGEQYLGVYRVQGVTR